MEKSVNVSASCVSVCCCGIQAVNHPGDPASESFTFLVTGGMQKASHCDIHPWLSRLSAPTFGCHLTITVHGVHGDMVYMVTWCTW